MNPQNQKASKFQKKRLSQEQVRLLEASFDAGRKLEPERKFELARDLNVPPRQIAIWYQNKRARWKNQSLESDYGAVQVQLEAALAGKRELQREVEMLRIELKRAQDTLFAFGQQACTGTSLSSCGEASSSLNDEVQGCSAANWPNVEDLYACLMVGGGAGGAAKGQNCPLPDADRDDHYWV